MWMKLIWHVYAKLRITHLVYPHMDEIMGHLSVKLEITENTYCQLLEFGTSSLKSVSVLAMLIHFYPHLIKLWESLNNKQTIVSEQVQSSGID